VPLLALIQPCTGALTPATLAKVRHMRPPCP
jgi:hypothetical protein